MATIKHLFHIAASRAEVFEAISSLNGLQNWWTADTKGDDNVGGILSFRFDGHGPDFKVAKLEKDKQVVWECVDGMPGWVGNIIGFSLDENDGKTRVRFTHDGLEAPDDAVAGINFTWGRYLVSLRQFCQSGVGAAYGSETYVQ